MLGLGPLHLRDTAVKRAADRGGRPFPSQRFGGLSQLGGQPLGCRPAARRGLGLP
jgi:hypothetical protein